MIGDRVRARAMRAELRNAEQAWGEVPADLEELAPGDRHTTVPQAGPLMRAR